MNQKDLGPREKKYKVLLQVKQVEPQFIILSRKLDLVLAVSIYHAPAIWGFKVIHMAAENSTKDKAYRF